MEDAHIASQIQGTDNNYIFGVFDGHGGAQVATFVERHFVKSLKECQNYRNKKYEDALRQTFYKMDEFLRKPEGAKQIKEIQKQMRQKQNGPKYQEDSHAGCTANVVLVTPDFIYCANAGDSRSIASIGGNSVFQLSKDHKPEDPIQLDRITKAGGVVSFGRVDGGLNLSRALGDLQYKKGDQKSPHTQKITANPDITKLKNENIDFIIMGCDGIWQVKSNSEMVDWIRKRLQKQQLKTIVEQLLDELVSKDSGNQYGMDNMSAILIKFNKKK